MATVEIDVTLIQLMHKLGCSIGLIMAVEEAKLAVSYDMSGVTVHATPETPYVSKVPDFGYQLSKKAGIKLGVLQMIVNGTLPGEAAKNVSRIQLEKAIMSVLSVLDTSKFSVGSDKTVDPDQTKSDPWVFGHAPNPVEVPPLVASVFSGSPQPAQSGNVSTPEQAKVSLVNAHDLYQPVSGSDDNSVYFAIAIGEGLNFGVRILGGTGVSIRVEGPLITEFKKQLAEAGLNDKGSYWSVHLKADTSALARKAIGAVLFGIGVKFKKMTCDMSPIWAKGV